MRNTLTDFLAALDPAPVRVWSLIMTVYGDCALPRGGELSLAVLTSVLGAFQVEPGAVRAAVSRLAKDGLLSRRRIGRTSHYALTETASALSRHAERLIYRDRSPRAPPGWDLAIPDPPNAASRRALSRHGYKTLSAGLMARPRRDDGAVEPQVPAILLRGETQLQAEARALAERLYDLAALREGYTAFVRAADELDAATDGADPWTSVLVRIALTHGFRRIALRDPHLSHAALPNDWSADQAYERFAAIYAKLRPASEAWLGEHALNGTLRRADHGNRFPPPGDKA